MKTTVSEKGQVTIPKRLRDCLGIRPGHILDFRGQEGHLVVAKVTPENPVESVYAIPRLGCPTDDLVRSLRGKANV